MNRYYYLDNAKFILIFLVVLGHLVEPLIKIDTTLKIVYLSIYSFHMPAFVMISGMLSKKNYQFTKLISSIVVPFVAFTILYEIWEIIITGDISHYTKHLQPYWILWYLYSLFFWRLILLFFSNFINFKSSIIIALSFIIAIIIGYVDSVGYFLGLSRTIYFFPFFIIGYNLTPDFVPNIQKRFNTDYIILSLNILILNIIFFLLFKDMQHQWLYGSYSYSRLGYKGLSGGIIRSVIYLISFLTAISILLLIPNKKMKFSDRGPHSLFVYVWHGFIVKLFCFTGIIYTIMHLLGSATTLFTLLNIAIVITIVFSSDLIVLTTQRFIIKPCNKLLANRS